MLKRKKKVAVLCLSPFQGGMELDSIRLCKKLGHIYDDVWLVCKEGSFIHEYAAKDEEVLNWHSIKFSYMFSFFLIFGLRDFLNKKSINNLIFFGASEMRSIFFALLGMDVNLIVRHGTTKRRKKKDLFHRLIYSNVSHHVGISKHLVNNIYEVLPLTENSEVNLIYSSLQFPDIPKGTKKKKSGNVNLVHVGRLAEGKGQDVAIKACSILFERNIAFKLYLVGSDHESYKGELQKLLDGLPYKESVVFLGHTNDVFSILSKADIFLFPSSGEGMPNALVEALSAGLVTIVYSNTVFPEIFAMGFYGHLVDNGNEERLKERLLWVAEHIDEEHEKSEKNIRLARELFSEEKEMSIYNRILV